MINIKKYVFVKQQGFQDCASACLLMIIRYYSGFTSLEYLRELTKTTKEGTSLYHIVEAAESLGFHAYGVKGNLEDLDSSLLPIIAHVILKKKYKHFVVIYKINLKNKKIVIADPADKLKTISFEEFKQQATGYYCILEPSKPLPKFNQTNLFSNFILKCLLQNKQKFILNLVFSFLIIFIHILVCYQIQFVLDYVIAYKSYFNLFVISLVFLFLMLQKNIFSFLKNKISIHLQNIFDEKLTISTFNHILSLPYFYYKNHPSGEILSRIKDSKELNEILSKNIVEIIFHFLLLLLILLVLLSTNQVFFVLACFLVFLYGFLFYIFYTAIEPLNQKLHIQMGKVNQTLIEYLNSVTTIKNLNILAIIKRKFYVLYKNFLVKSHILFNKCNHLNFLFSMFDSISQTLFLFLCVILIMKHNKNIGFLFTYQQLFSYFIDSLSTFFQTMLSIKNSKITFERVKELFLIEEEKSPKQGLLKKVEGNIEIKNLNFSFSKHKILKNINLKITKGNKVLVYGPSGSGKSTLVKMLLRLIDCKRNEILLDKVDLLEYDPFSLRENICYLSQNEMLLTDTIYNNVTLFRNIQYEEFLKVSKLSLLDEVIAHKTLSYDTVLEENGFNLSGGERQRILLARILLKKANVYILDESLSEIDIKRERIILKKLFALYKDKTMIVISHRFDNQDLFDQKIKIENGRCYDG